MKYQLTAMAFAILFLLSCKSRPAPATNPTTIDPVMMEQRTARSFDDANAFTPFSTFGYKRSVEKVRIG